MAKRSTRSCIDCKADISKRGNKSVRCQPCHTAYRAARERLDPNRARCVDDDGTCSTSRLKRGRCSRHYYTARRDGDGMIPQRPRTCPTCKTTFMPVRSDAVCCSSDCNWRWQDTFRRVDHPERDCLTCGQPYKPARSDQRYCVIDCHPDPKYRASRRWHEQNRGRVADLYHRRRVRERSAIDSVGVTPRDWKRLIVRYGGRCAYCRERCERPTVDHIIPVMRGGRHSIGNTLPACLSCNSSKGGLLLIEFKVRRGMIRLRDCVAVERPIPVGGLDVFAGVRYEQLMLPLGIGGPPIRARHAA
jgi:hypothetical protein